MLPQVACGVSMHLLALQQTLCDLACLVTDRVLERLACLRRHTYEELAVVGIVAFFLFIIETASGGIDPTQRHSFEVSLFSERGSARAFCQHIRQLLLDSSPMVDFDGCAECAHDPFPGGDRACGCCSGVCGPLDPDFQELGAH